MSILFSLITVNAAAAAGWLLTHTTLLVETYHQHRRLRALIEKLVKEGSCPMQILGDDGDWTKNDFWAAVKFFRFFVCGRT
ncbi:hypothetical protein ERO13_D02G105900v2 [Gossypium hirsutum]|uniref:Pentatricopeptide repeat-containing protein At4g14190, chloroplastic n=2 Tax=Gossypium TaxID=3633 RepID=A0A1U8JUY1_GOSHI|nr:pentatricopeptide repeat-containing protein At4g14190, chloroplastic-like [Gossypium hirsutum]KAG4158201.1 hypothetical protein ERO13_D02G105900v2 [Gossypium hirsutum]KAG4158202.1 hypothetical protein ERO13_D02G105900v2 [Gossypium hirsutum]TYH83486.1 hypothetical protein ES332_D02G135400v1 [Gossypium tomentosum]